MRESRAFSEGLMIAQSDAIKVVAVRGTRVLVQPADELDDLAARQTGPADSDAGFTDDESANPPPLDFDVSQS